MRGGDGAKGRERKRERGKQEGGGVMVGETFTFVPVHGGVRKRKVACGCRQ